MVSERAGREQNGCSLIIYTEIPQKCANLFSRSVPLRLCSTARHVTELAGPPLSLCGKPGVLRIQRREGLLVDLGLEFVRILEGFGPLRGGASVDRIEEALDVR